MRCRPRALGNRQAVRTCRTEGCKAAGLQPRAAGGGGLRGGGRLMLGGGGGLLGLESRRCSVPRCQLQGTAAAAVRTVPQRGGTPIRAYLGGGGRLRSEGEAGSRSSLFRQRLPGRSHPRGARLTQLNRSLLSHRTSGGGGLMGGRGGGLGGRGGRGGSRSGRQRRARRRAGRQRRARRRARRAGPGPAGAEVCGRAEAWWVCPQPAHACSPWRRPWGWRAESTGRKRRRAPGMGGAGWDGVGWE